MTGGQERLNDLTRPICNDLHSDPASASAAFNDHQVGHPRARDGLRHATRWRDLGVFQGLFVLRCRSIFWAFSEYTFFRIPSFKPNPFSGQ